MTYNITRTIGPCVVRDDANRPVTWADALHFMEQPRGREWFLKRLRNEFRRCNTTDNVIWECEPVTAASAATQPFRFVLHEIDLVVPCAQHLAFFGPGHYDHRQPQPTAPCVATTFKESAAAAAEADPKTSDAVLVVPGAGHCDWLCGNIKSYSAVLYQLAVLFKAVAEEVRAAFLRDPLTPVWVSTHGVDVHWVAVRVEREPRLYAYTPFCSRH